MEAEEKQEEQLIELRSEEVQEILGTPPKWIVRWGTTLAFFVLAVLFFVSWLVKYPEIREARIVLTTKIPPSPMVAREDGNIEKLFVTENDLVEKGQLLVVLQNPGNFEDVLMLEGELVELKTMDEDKLLVYQPDRTLVLGELQSGYSGLLEKFETFNRNESTDFAQQSVARLQGEKRAVLGRINVEKSNLEDMKLELENAKSDQKRVQQLNVSQITSRKDLEDAQDRVLAVKRREKQIRSNILLKEQELLNLDNQILSIENNKQESTGANFITLREDAHRLQSVIADWKQRFLITAPVDGRIAFDGLIKENQYVKSGTTLLRIIPDKDKEWIGRVELPTIGSGKVEKGQRVVIKFDNYPFEENGVVEGIVQSKSLLPSGDMYDVEVIFPNNLKTSYGTKIPHKPEMQGKAEIITDNKRFIGWVFDKLVSRFKTY